MSLTNRLRIACRRVSFALLMLGVLPSCGSGGTTETAASSSGFLLTNNGLTFGGQANVHAIVSYTLTPAGSSNTMASGPVMVEPGDAVFVPLTTGRYTLTATFDDGHTERLQVPPDQVDALAEEVRTILFVY
jgi:hypothetical protein